jgi:hypothetical protein
MDNHAEGQEFAKARAISRLDWPTPEMLAAARRARGKAVREMTVAFGRWLKTRVAEHLFAVGLGRSKARPAQARIANRR